MPREKPLTRFRHPREGGTTESGISQFHRTEADSLLTLRALWNERRVMAMRGERRVKREMREKSRTLRSEKRDERKAGCERRERKPKLCREANHPPDFVILDREERPIRGSLGSLLSFLNSQFSILHSQSAALSIRSKEKKPLSFDRGFVLFR